MNTATATPVLTEQEIIAGLQANENVSMSQYRVFERAWDARLAALLGLNKEEAEYINFRDRTRVQGEDVINSSTTTISVRLPGGMGLSLHLELPENSKSVYVTGELLAQVRDVNSELKYKPHTQGRRIAAMVSTSVREENSFETLAKAFQYVAVAIVSEHLKSFGLGVTDATNAAMKTWSHVIDGARLREAEEN